MQMQFAVAIDTTLVERKARMRATDVADEKRGNHG
jgi:hypothetical protein